MNALHLRLATLGAALTLAGATPALAAPVSDGTSNTIQVAEVTVDQAHHRVLVGAAGAKLTPGQHLRNLQLVTPSLKWVFSDILVESLTGTSTGLSLNFTKVEFVGAHGPCTAGADACLIESDGTYPPFAA